MDRPCWTEARLLGFCFGPPPLHSTIPALCFVGLHYRLPATLWPLLSEKKESQSLLLSLMLGVYGNGFLRRDCELEDDGCRFQILLHMIAETIVTGIMAAATFCVTAFEELLAGLSRSHNPHSQCKISNKKTVRYPNILQIFLPILSVTTLCPAD